MAAGQARESSRVALGGDRSFAGGSAIAQALGLHTRISATQIDPTVML